MRREAADQVAVLVGRIRQPLDVRVLALERLHGKVGDGELRVRELISDVFRRIRQQEAGRDDDVVTGPRERCHVRQVVGRGARLHRSVLDLQLLRRSFHSSQLVLVEALVVEASDVAHKPRLERGPWCRSAARYETYGRAERYGQGCQPKRQQSFVAQEMLPPPRDPSQWSEAM